MILRLTLLALVTASPLWAKDAPNLDPKSPAVPGAVALYLSAQGLYALGVSARDPLMVVTAARMMRGLSVIATPRQPDPEPKTAVPLESLDAKTMLATARKLDAGANYPDLIEFVAAETPPAPKALRATPSQLPPGASEAWTLPFFGGTYGELGIAGHGNGNLDLLVTDAAGNHICWDNGSADTAICGFTPAENGDFTLTVTNSGATPDSYILLTN